MFRYFIPLVIAAIVVWNAQGAAPNKVGDFMQLKLVHSQKVLEGIALEDYDLIAKNSQNISLLCEDELWQVFQTPDYLQHSEQFRRTANAVAESARKKNLDGAVGITSD